MIKMRFVFFCVFWIGVVNSIAQNQTIKGKVVDEVHYPIVEAEVTLNNQKVLTDYTGGFELTFETGTLTISKEGFEPFSKELSTYQESIAIELVPNDDLTKLVVFQKQKTDLSSIEIDPSKALAISSISGGVEDLVKMQMGVSSNTELSSQYMVRGGSFDENLVYINGLEQYRPQLTRTGQQEGMSIINSSMVSLINFSAGGFESKYGDKMSSVLDIHYKKPKKFEGYLDAGLIGGGLTLGFSNKSGRLSSITGVRYRNTNLLLNTLEGDTDINPVYMDAQTYTEYYISPRVQISFLGNISKNTFELEPKRRETEFGTISQPIRLTVIYRGKEDDSYQAENGALSVIYQPIKDLKMRFSSFVTHTTEQEYFDIAAGYILQELDPATGDPVLSFGTGGQLNHARNDLDILVAGGQWDAEWRTSEQTRFDAGFKYQIEDVRDFLTEWQFIDSLGYSLPRPIVFPPSIDDSSLELDYYISNRLNLQTHRMSGYAQASHRFLWGQTKVYVNGGVRFTHWDFNDELNISPRLQFAIKPDWKEDMLFRFATGVYYQPPFYKDIRGLDGNINPEVKSQRSLHFILGHDYELQIWERPFKLTTETFYKSISDLNPYFVDNVRIRYTAQNNATGRVYGLETRLHGEFVPGIESWFTLGYTKAEQNIDDRGYIPLPTDPRFKASVFFQDYMKFMPQMRASISYIYASGLPQGAPLFTDPYSYQNTLRSYNRADLGLSYVFINEEITKKKPTGMWKSIQELSLGLQIYNVFDFKNEISNQWLRDVNSQFYYAVPNRLTGRVFNVRLQMKF